MDRTDTRSESNVDAASESCPDNTDREVHSHLPFKTHTTATYARSGEYYDNDDDGDDSDDSDVDLLLSRDDVLFLPNS